MRVAVSLLCSMLFLGAAKASPSWNKVPKTHFPWLQSLVPPPEDCGSGTGRTCNISLLEQQCLANSQCNAFDSDGRLLHCPNGWCDCSVNASACPRASNSTDSWVLAGLPTPSDWVDAVANASMLFSSRVPPVCYVPEVGNGYLGTVPGWGAMYVAGLFTGGCGATHKARLPSSAAISLSKEPFAGAALDLRRAAYLQRWAPADHEDVIVEQRTYAHRTRRNVLVTDFTIVAAGSRNNGAVGGDAAMLSVPIVSFWDPGAADTQGLPGQDCAGQFVVDVSLHQKPVTLGDSVEAWIGSTITANEDGDLFNVSIILDKIPDRLELPVQVGASLELVTVIMTSLDLPERQGTAERVLQAAVAEWDSLPRTSGNSSSSVLFDEHVASWATLWQSGFSVEAPAGSTLATSPMAMEVATHANTSQYFLFSSVRPEWKVGVSPGGIATANYEGAVFFDQDFYILPPFRLLFPEGSACVTDFRYESLSAAHAIAELFGYPALPGATSPSAMYAWTSAYRGRAFGCCTGIGGYEDCLEQHITGDVAAAVWWEWLVSGDRQWLKDRAWPILQAVAEFSLARVSPRPPLGALLASTESWAQELNESYSVVGVLPVDEWCVNSGCGCETPGVTDDAQMNAVVILSLRYAMAAAQELGLASNRTALYGAVADRVRMPWNETAQRHNQWSDAAESMCPGGIGGTNYSPDHTVCPEDVLYLSYPMAEAMNVSLATTRRDAERFLPITCKENAGMTTPIHTITLLDLDQPEDAQAAFNRSLRAACYGPFNVRNEVDKHADIVGGHFDNTHFLTGDGGFLQGLQNGYARIRIAEDGGLWIRRPVVLPQGVGTLKLRRLQWRGGAVVLDVSISAEGSATPTTTVDAVKIAKDLGKICLRDNAGLMSELQEGDSITLDKPEVFPAKILRACPQ